ncbi:MAG: M15 family metallopeptidase [Candidatus Paceibacterota bacterium]|jgi:LAS superfamily LD-carboxypeptidase LdcB
MKNKALLSILLILVIVLALGVAAGAYYSWLFHQKNLVLETKNRELQNLVATTTGDLASTTARLQAETERTNALSEEVSSIAGTVGTLNKLSQTDKELLKKYSKVYFLNEHYAPANLATVTPAFWINHEPQLIHFSVAPYLEKLLERASSSGIDLRVSSAFRSFGTQTKIKANYKITYGSGANKFSADQGYSEHQLGTTVDFGTPSINGDYNKFGKTTSFTWLTENAYRYGFIMSYPPDNSYYQYEPWHWRFVGVALATKLHEENKYFYNYPQRLIDVYLVNIFD